jgi:hypothetical protein
MEKKLFSVEEVAAHFKVSPATIKRAVKNGWLPARRLRAQGNGKGHLLRFTQTDIDRYWGNCAVVVPDAQPPAPPLPAPIVRRRQSLTHFGGMPIKRFV